MKLLTLPCCFSKDVITLDSMLSHWIPLSPVRQGSSSGLEPSFAQQQFLGIHDVLVSHAKCWGAALSRFQLLLPKGSTR